jgi:uncharacterized membrane protein YphA (DoxX/SURF4 family)
VSIRTLDSAIIKWLRHWYQPLARGAVFVIYFYFGVLKLTGDSPATPIAEALVGQTIGLAHFHTLFILLALFECLIGLLFLFPKATRLVIPLLLIHMVIVCSPLAIVPQLAFAKPFVPTLEGQYIIKNIALIALALGVAAQTRPIHTKSRSG